MEDAALIGVISDVTENSPKGVASVIQYLRIELDESLFVDENQMRVCMKILVLTSVLPLAYSWYRLNAAM